VIRNINANTDTNTQAMTEVALGLSMAFFSLLILALLSMSTESMSKHTQRESATQHSSENAQRNPTDILMQQSRLSLSEQSDAQRTSDSGQAKQNQEQVSFVFYYQGSYFDASLSPYSPENVDPNKPTVVAVLPNLSFFEVMQVHKDFAHQSIQITAMDNNWQNAFAALGPEAAQPKSGR
jgi:hypothetical protein